jgi:ribosomal protein L14
MLNAADNSGARSLMCSGLRRVEAAAMRASGDIIKVT